MNPERVVKRRMLYDPDSLSQALVAVLEDGQTIRGAARLYGVPSTTLSDRVHGRVSIDCTKPGPSPTLSNFEEASLCEHVKYMSSIGYGYSRSEVMSLASEYLVSMGRREPGKPMSDKWFYNFLKRWPELKLVKPSSLEMVRAKNTTPEVINKYFSELENILDKYCLRDKPECIYNVDEKGINAEHKPPSVVGGFDSKPQALTSPRLTVTVIACGNANGMAIPPFFVFKGARMLPDLLQNTCTGAAGTVSPSGWSNSRIFKQYLLHFEKYCQGQGTKLILFDGHKSHINPDTIAWAKRNDIVLFVLPPHTSWVLQPLDVACFRSFSRCYNAEAKKYMTNHPGQVITRYNIAEIASNAYGISLSSPNLKSAFRKCGIHPFDPSAYAADKCGAHIIFQEDAETLNATPPQTDPTVTAKNSFFQEKSITASSVRAQFVPPKQRQTLSRVVGGKPITEDHVSHDINAHLAKQKKVPAPGKGKKSFVPPFKGVPLDVQVPSTSGISKTHVSPEEVSDESDSEMHESEKCCVCGKFYPPERSNLSFIAIVNWGKCSECSHWTHLAFCTKIRSVRRHSIFLCPHCDVNNEP